MPPVDAANRAPGFAKTPDYRIRLAPARRRIQAVVGYVTVADSDGVLVMREQDHAPVYYFPRDDVRTELLSRTDRDTFCPFKGHATYWTVTAGNRTEENVGWSYEAPYEEMRAIAGMIAFYQDRVKLEVL